MKMKFLPERLSEITWPKPLESILQSLRETVLRGGTAICNCGLGILVLFVFCLVLLVSFLTLLSASPPKVYLHELYIHPALNKTLMNSSSTTETDTTLYFQLKFDNPNQCAGVYYDHINLTFYQAPPMNHIMAKTTIHQFYLAAALRWTKQRETTKDGEVKITGLDREAALQEILERGYVVFGVDLETSITYSYAFLRSKRHTMKIGAYVKVNDRGTKVNPMEDIEFKSSSSTNFELSVAQNNLVGLKALSNDFTVS